MLGGEKKISNLQECHSQLNQVHSSRAQDPWIQKIRKSERLQDFIVRQEIQSLQVATVGRDAWVAFKGSEDPLQDSGNLAPDLWAVGDCRHWHQEASQQPATNACQEQGRGARNINAIRDNVGGKMRASLQTLRSRKKRSQGQTDDWTIQEKSHGVVGKGSLSAVWCRTTGEKPQETINYWDWRNRHCGGRTEE